MGFLTSRLKLNRLQHGARRREHTHFADPMEGGGGEGSIQSALLKTDSWRLIKNPCPPDADATGCCFPGSRWLSLARVLLGKFVQGPYDGLDQTHAESMWRSRVVDLGLGILRSWC